MQDVIIKHRETMAYTPSFAVKKAAIDSRAKKVNSDIVRTIDIVNLVMMLKKRFANGTLLAPMQFPIRALVASDMPIDKMKSVAETEKIIVKDASSLTPRMPAKMVRISNAHHSAQIIITEGREMHMYSPQPLKASLFIGISATLT